jgi:copper chaperone
VNEIATYRVPAMHCDHCKAAVSAELSHVDGVESVKIDLDTKQVVVRGEQLDEHKLRLAIGAAGYEIA